MVFRCAKTIKNAVVNGVKSIFSLVSDEISPYAYNEDLKQTKIFVYRAFPSKSPIYPSIVIMSSTGNVPITTYFQDHVSEGTTTDTIGGSFDITITVTVIAESTVDKENVMNILLKGLVYISRSVFDTDGMVLQNPIGLGGETQDTYGGAKMYHSQSLNLRFYSEWEEDAGPYALLSKVDIYNSFSLSEE